MSDKKLQMYWTRKKRTKLTKWVKMMDTTATGSGDFSLLFPFLLSCTDLLS